MTGHYPFIGLDEGWETPSAFGMRRFYRGGSEPGLPHRLETLPEQLNGSGYTTAGIITNPYLKRVFNFHRGFDEYTEIFRDQGIPYGRGEAVSQSAVRFLRSTPKQPFFLYLHYMDTHGPYNPPEEYRARFGVDEGLSSFPGLWKIWEHRGREQELEPEGLAEYMRNRYDGAVAYVDDCLGQVIRELEELGLSENTVVVVTADHGEEFLEHGGTTHKGTLYEELMRIPMLIRLPGREGSRIPDLVRNFDLMPTLLDLAGISTEGQGLDAISLLPLLADGARLPRLEA